MVKPKRAKKILCRNKKKKITRKYKMTRLWMRMWIMRIVQLKRISHKKKINRIWMRLS